MNSKILRTIEIGYYSNISQNCDKVEPTHFIQRFDKTNEDLLESAKKMCPEISKSPTFRVFNSSAIHYETNNYGSFAKWDNMLKNDRSENNLREYCKPYEFTNLRLPHFDIAIPMCLWPAKDDIYVSASIISGSVWDPPIVQKFLQHIVGGTDIVIFDGGMNIGQFTIIAAYFNATVIAFEPMPAHVEMVKKSLYMNGIHKRVHMFRNGLAANWNMLYLNEISVMNNKGGSYVSEKIESKNYHEIEIIPFDSVLPYLEDVIGKDFKIKFMKVDIEGYEPQFVMGAVDLFARHDINTIAFELSHHIMDKYKCGIHEFVEMFKVMGYNMGIMAGEVVNIYWDGSQKLRNSFENHFRTNDQINFYMFNVKQ
jgi:FkbM family methyltransferase